MDQTCLANTKTIRVVENCVLVPTAGINLVSQLVIGWRRGNFLGKHYATFKSVISKYLKPIEGFYLSSHLFFLVDFDNDDSNNNYHNDDEHYDKVSKLITLFVAPEGLGSVRQHSNLKHLQTIRRHHHFLRLRLRAFSMAPPISTFALTTFSWTSSPLRSMSVTNGSCCTTIASRSVNNSANSTIWRSIF